MIEQYLKQEEERAAEGVPALPLTEEQTQALCELVLNPKDDQKDLLLNLLVNRVSPGVDPAANIKAQFLLKVAKEEVTSSIISPEEAVKYLGTMVGGYNLKPLIELLENPKLAEKAAEALKEIILIADYFEDVAELSKTNTYAKSVIESWANAEWFKNKPVSEESVECVVYKVDGEINTDDFSPASEAWSRPDIPVHALSMGVKRFPDGIETIAKFRKEGLTVAFVGDVVGTGSSRKSACNSLLWHIGEDIPFIPNKRKGGIILGGQIAPIFYNTAEDSGALPIRCDVSHLKTGDRITIDLKNKNILGDQQKTITSFEYTDGLAEEVRAGGRVPLIIGKSLTEKSRQFLGMGEEEIFVKPVKMQDSGKGYTLAQKIIGKACGQKGVQAGEFCTPTMTTVGSQDTTGPMTRDEMVELACLGFQSDFVMQSFCHTAAYPKLADIKTHNTLPQFISNRKGVALRPGDGVIHPWLNRFLLPDTVGTGGDSHTRFPIGISFPAGSGLVAFAAALGKMPLEVPESVLVRFKGKLNPGITLRDAVNAIPYVAIQKGLMTVEKKNKKNIFNGRILEMEGLPNISVEQAFELTDASAERSAAASVIQLDESVVIEYLESNIALMKKMIKDGYADHQTLQKRIESAEEWLKTPTLLKADSDAEYAEVIEIDLSEITEPILCCPNDPDDVKLLSDVENTKLDDVFIGSCMTNIGHFRAASEILKNQGATTSRLWICPPTRMDEKQLREEGIYSIFGAAGARIEIPGCSLCMGNQARVADKAVVLSTSTRNFDNRMGNDAKVYLGSAELAAVSAKLGRIPTKGEYLSEIEYKVTPAQEKVYTYLNFSKMEEYQ